MGWYFAFFLLSGFCSILYELIWLRLTMAQYGVTTALVSITLSMFMLGMGAGSWLTGALVRRNRLKGRAPLRFYALAEFLIGTSSLIVPGELTFGHRLLASLTGTATMSSASYYLASGTLVALTLLPWCFCMGATYPLAMAAIEGDGNIESSRSFSYLYLSNVVGALAGAIIPLLLIETRGFYGTLRVGSACNALIAALAFGLSFLRRGNSAVAPATMPGGEKSSTGGAGALALLFLTGLATMGMEVVWIRLFTPYAGPLVYSFAMILATYLAATFAGSVFYRRASSKGDASNPLAWILLALVGLLPLLTSDPRFPLNPLQRIFIGIAPFATLIGFLTPMLVDRWSKGDPDRAGRAYAVNVVGCIVGPLLSGFVLLPLFGEHISMLVYVLPWIAMAFLLKAPAREFARLRVAGFGIVVASLAVFFLTKDSETIYPQREVLRDSTATVIATGEGMGKRLITNGVGMTKLTPVTKMMAHLTFSSLEKPPQNALIICFGMGTTFRSALSWNVPTTAVELVPSVPRLFPYFHADAPQVLGNPRAHVVIDDGRRFLERSSQRFDAVIIDPPPPVGAAASSLLYSRDFYGVLRARLNPGGILQQWLPNGDEVDQAAVAKSLKQSFGYVKVYKSIEGWGWHLLASDQPIPDRTAAELVARMPAPAVKDMMEWGPAATPEEQFQRVLSTELPIDSLINAAPDTPMLSDDRPINEYFLLRAMAAAKRNAALNSTTGQIRKP
jgi:spermidine synthase